MLAFHPASLYTIPEIVRFYTLLPHHAAILYRLLDDRGARKGPQGTPWYRWSDLEQALDNIMSVEADLDHLRWAA